MSIDRLQSRIDAACRTLIPDGARVLVAVSGGGDSLALLHRLALLAPTRRWTLAVAHVNHRQDPSIDDLAVATLRTLADSLTVPFFTAEADLPEGSSEARLRQARYAFLTETARTWGASHVAVGHHADDQAETLLLRLLRGAVAGLGGMHPSRPLDHDHPDIRLVRPLLTLRRRDLHAYGQAHGLHPIADPSNDNPRFRRNRVRHALLPTLEADWPGVGGVLARTAHWLREDDDLLQAMADTVLAALPAAPGDVPLSPLQAAPGPIRRRVLRRVLAERGVPALAAADLAALDAVVTGQRPGTGLPGDWQVRRHGGYLSVSRHAVTTPPTAVPFAAPQDDTPLPGWSHRLTVRLAQDEREDAWQIRLPQTVPLATLQWRAAQPGDRLATDAGRMNVGELLRQCGLSPAARRAHLVLADAEGVLWVVGVRRSNRLVASEGSEAAWLVRITDTGRPEP